MQQRVKTLKKQSPLDEFGTTPVNARQYRSGGARVFLFTLLIPDRDSLTILGWLCKEDIDPSWLHGTGEEVHLPNVPVFILKSAAYLVPVVRLNPWNGIVSFLRQIESLPR